MIIADFRAEFPEFASVTDYPDAMITFWSTLAEKMVVLAVWGELYATGVKLYTAHELVLARRNAQAGVAGGTPGIFTGAASSKSVGGASISYDTTSATEKDAGWWNLTTYGRQFWRLAQMLGMGCIQL